MILFPGNNAAGRHLDVDWADREWTPRIIVGPAASAAGVWFERPRRLLTAALGLKFSCRKPLSASPKSMMKTHCRIGRVRRGFTLIEMLVVISIIAILAGLLLPVFARAKLKVKIANCKSDMQGLISAINQYDTTYSRYPGNVNGQDYTYGSPFAVTANSTNSNANLMIILTDLNVGINFNHAKNPQNIAHNAKQTADTNSPGMSSVDYQLRDYFGHPYVISIDYDGDGYTKDTMYSLPVLNGSPGVGGKGPNGLVDYGSSNVFLLHSPVMIWSLGPDGKADQTLGPSAVPNLDNILSWQ